MHEVGIANSVLDAVRSEMRRFPNGHVYKVGVRIGEFAGVDPQAITFCFEALVRGTELEPLELEIEYCRRREICIMCGYSEEPDRNAACPHCGFSRPRTFRGDELELTYLEVDDGTRAAGA